MPIRRPETGHEALFTAHRRTRHLNAITQEAPTAEAPSRGLPAAADGAPAPGAPQKASAALARSADAGPGTRADADVTTTDRQPRRRRLVAANTAAAASDEMMSIKMVVPYPARGTSPALDALAAEIGEDAAVRSLLRRAFDDFRGALDAGEVPEALPAYDEVGATVTTTRRISRRAHGIAVQHLDPARLLSDRAFARLLARRALAYFFEAEQCCAAKVDPS
ncbi:VirC2 family conjugal transfer protein [Roseitranquillus sediminis]|uniref:VirC2 family conjugal transfer protein n=1 Tax=Roseitranquillus sediminis TaxID=2809051 RepID=UPI001D0C22BF|nr:VirC2 family conjugal transfer protein [Roseitranquillus sediminis]MBM9595068.1 VirC2 family conjugal transfer protein [Roseitranquillus sediminis]